MNSARLSPRTLIVVSLLLLGTFFTSTWLNDSSQPSALAQAPQPEATNQIVERWHGTATSWFDSPYADCFWLCPGEFHYMDIQEWYIEVQEDGSFTGYVRRQVIDYSYNQSETNLLCGPVAETNYYIEDCVYAGQVTQPESVIRIEGERTLEYFTQRPILRITSTTVTQECQATWTARGVHSKTRQIVHKQENTNCTRHIITPHTLYIETDAEGRSPRISLDNAVRSGQLIGTIEEPFLELDREFLERSIFLDQISVEERFLVKMNWNSPDGGWISWKIDDAETERVGPSKVEELPKPINVGTQGVGKKRLSAQAKTTLNRNSDPEVTQIVVAPPPGWAGSPAEINATKVDGAVAYKNSIRFPNPAFEGQVNVPTFIPWLGGKPLGLKKTQGALAWEAQSTSEGRGSLSGQTGFDAMGGSVTGSITGRARVLLDETGVSIPEGGITFGIAGTIASKAEPLLKVVPSLNPALTVIEKILPSAARFIEERAKAKLELQPKLDFSFNYFTENDEIKFKNAEAKPGFGFKTIAEIKLIKDVLQATASIGGAISATFQVPEPYFKEAALQGLVQARITLYRWAWQGEKAWSVILKGASAAMANADEWLAQSAGSWQPLARDYLAMPNYARWHGSIVSASASGQGTEDLLMVENVFPLANPSLHVWIGDSGQKRIFQAWAHDNPDAPENSGGEIMASRNSGAGWLSPLPQTADNYDDLAPKVVTMPNRQTILLWQRMDTPTPPNIEPEPAEYLKHWQIAARLYGSYPTDPPQILTSGSLNHRHQLAAVSDGALAVWVNNPANQIIGSPGKADIIYYSHYDTDPPPAQRAWMTPTVVITNVVGLLSYDLATNGQHAAIVYSSDINGDLTSYTDSELFYTTWNGATWSAPVRLTNNGMADENPQLVLDESGAPTLVWQQNGVLKFLRGDWANAPTTLPLPNAAERPDYDLVQSRDGHLALVWQEPGPEDTRIGYAVYDAIHNRWSGELTITPPEGAEGSMATSIAAGMLPADEDSFDKNEVNGQLVFAYQLAHVTVVTRPVENVETGNGIADNVPIAYVADIGQRDLRVATQPLRMNLTVSPGDLSLLNANTIQAVIHNTGELVITNAPVALHLGSADPVSGITQKLTQNIPLIAAGSVATLTFNIAGQSTSLFVVEIDPDRTLGESDTSDNRATLATDIAIAPQPARYGPDGTTVRAQITQQGSRYVSMLSDAILTVDSPDGPVVGGGQFAFPLTPTESISLTAFISTTMLGEGRHFLYWTLDPSGTLGEADRSNNIAGTSIMILPDLAAIEASIDFGTAPGNTAPFQMFVQNLGNWPNDASVAQVFDGPPGEAGTNSLAQFPIPTIEPGSTQEISGTLNLAGLPAATTGLTGIYIQLDPADAVEESNENNNLLAAGAVLEAADIQPGESPGLYLPVLKR